MFLYQSPANENNYAKLEKLNLSIVLHIIRDKMRPIICHTQNICNPYYSSV